MSITEIIKRVQRELGVTADGIAGPITWNAIYNAIVHDHEIAVESDPVDERSEGNIATLHPEVKPYARALVRAAAAQGITIKVISGNRTYEQQNALYEQGRSKPGPIVTKVRGGHSNHNFALAFDIGVFDEGRYLPESDLYKVVGAIGRSLGLEWGGDWRTFVDQPHFQLRPAWAEGLSDASMMAELRKRHDSGKDAFA